MFDGFEKEIESFKGNEETWRKVHAVGGADSFGVVYMATGNTRFIDRRRWSRVELTFESS